MKAWQHESSVVRSKNKHPATSLKSDMTKISNLPAAGTTAQSSDKKLDGDEVYESTIDSGFLSGSCVYESGTWESEDQPKANVEEERSNFTRQDFDNVKTLVSRELSSELPEIENLRIREAFEPDEEGDTHLHLAVVQGIPEVIDHLIERVPETTYLDCMNDLLQSPLHLAVLTHQPKIVRKLVASGASLDLRDRYGNTPLHIACASGNIKCVKQLTVPFTLTKGDVPSATCSPDLPQDLELRNYDGYTCFHLATFSARLDIMEHLANYGADVNARGDREGWTALHFSVDAKNVEITKFLLERMRSDPKVQNYRGVGPLHLIQPALNLASKNSYKKVRVIRDMLIRFGAQADSSSLPESDNDDDESDLDVSDDDNY